MEHNRFFVLLGALTVLFISAPLVRQFGPPDTPLISQASISATFVVLLLSAVFAVARTRSTTIAAVSLVVPVTVLEAVQFAYPDLALELPIQLLGIGFLGFVVFVIVRFIFVTDRVTANTICAAICVYLLLGVLWALALSVVEIAESDSFTASQPEWEGLQFGSKQSSDALYFSFVTLTTLGFGDITPSSPTAKMLVAMEAVVGQLFLTILVARLVGLHITQSTSEQRRDNET